jgi:phage terminase small subunit
MTQKQKRLERNLVNSSSLKEAVLKSGYSESTARHAVRSIMNGKGLQDVISRKDKRVIKRHYESLDAMKWYFPHESPDFQDIDHQSRLKAVELHYKARGWLKEDSIHVGDNIQINVSGYGDTDHFSKMASQARSEPK